MESSPKCSRDDNAPKSWAEVPASRAAGLALPAFPSSSRQRREVDVSCDDDEHRSRRFGMLDAMRAGKREVSAPRSIARALRRLKARGDSPQPLRSPELPHRAVE